MTAHGSAAYGVTPYGGYGAESGDSSAGSQATETDTARAGTPAIALAGSQATETDTARAGTPVGGEGGGGTPVVSSPSLANLPTAGSFLPGNYNPSGAEV